VTNNSVANDLAQRLVGFGVTVSNATLNCDPIATGDFDVVSSNLGLDSGIVLTSGTAASTPVAVGVNGPTNFASTSHTTPGDADLTLLCNKPTFDACILDFDFVTIGDTVKFNYVFGSQEYPGFTCTNFNDVFGFFISGPGIAGPYTNAAENIALVPGSTTCPVGVSTIYCPNSPGCCNTPNFCFNLTPGCGAFSAANNTCAYFVCNAGGTTVNYEGFTTVLEAVSAVVPCSTYHFKLAIADAQDRVLDSGVFIESGSFTSNVVDLKIETGLTSVGGTPYIIEGCDTARLSIKRKILGTPFADTVNFIIAGNATPGVDYPTLPGQITFTANANDTVQSLDLFAFNDGITEMNEFIKIYVQSGCSGFITDSIVIEIRDSLSYQLFNSDTSICLGDTVFINGQIDSGIDFSWSPITHVNDPTDLLTYIYPTTFGDINYTLVGTYKTCAPVTKNLRIKTDPIPSLLPLPDREVCGGDTLQLFANVSPPFGYIVDWQATSGLSNTSIYNPIFTGTATQDIVVNITSPNAACFATDTFHIDVWPYATGTIRDDTVVCNGDPVPLWATSSTGKYLWTPGGSLLCDTCANTTAFITGDETYEVILIEPHGCNDTLSVRVESHPPFNLVLHNNDTTIYLGDEVKMKATGAPFIFWTPTNYLSYSQSGDPTAKPLEDIMYYVTGVSLYHGCPQIDSVKIDVILQDVFVPNAFSPNGDGLNDIFRVVARKLINVQEFRIFNRWGQEVFSTNNINQGWDGTFKGELQDAGTYYYMMRVSYPTRDGRTDFLKGNIHLLR